MHARHMAALAELSQSALKGTELPALMEHAVNLIAESFTAAGVEFLELLPDRSAALDHSSRGFQGAGAGQATHDVAALSLVAHTLLNQAPVVVEAWEQETRFSQPAHLRERGILSSILAPVGTPQCPFGVLGIHRTLQGPPEEAELHCVQAIANMLAMAIEHSRFSQSVEEARLVALAQRQAILEERQRLARDLHDSITQAFYSVTLHAEAALRLLAAGDLPTVEHYLRGLQQTAQEALEEMRLLIFELRPPILEQEGLVVALRARLNAVEGHTNLATTFVVDGVTQLPPSVEQRLYRIAQEALNNVLKHARAQQLTVSLRQEQGTVQLQIDDDGVGFEPISVRARSGLGLRGIEERVAQLQGRLTIESAPGAGTRIKVEVDL